MIAPGIIEREKTILSIQKNISDYFNIPIEQMNLPTRKREIVEARQIAMFFARFETKKSLATIGNCLGDKDHATVLNAIRTIRNIIATDKQFKNQMLNIQKRFGFLNTIL
jgi:chromosomal replication initiator protein